MEYHEWIRPLRQRHPGVSNIAVQDFAFKQSHLANQEVCTIVGIGTARSAYVMHARQDSQCWSQAISSNEQEITTSLLRLFGLASLAPHIVSHLQLETRSAACDYSSPNVKALPLFWRLLSRQYHLGQVILKRVDKSLAYGSLMPDLVYRRRDASRSSS